MVIVRNINIKDLPGLSFDCSFASSPGMLENLADILTRRVYE